MDNSIQIPVLRPDTKISIPDISVNTNYNPFDKTSNYRYATPSSAGRVGEGYEQNWETLYTGFENEKRQPDIFSDPAVETQCNTEASPITINNHFQFKGRYILTSVKSGLMLIDQKRAHERILFEHYLVQMVNRNGASQQCLFPETVELSPDEMSLWLELREDFAALGFDIKLEDRECDGLKVNIHGNPGDIGIRNPAELFRKLLDDFRHTETDLFESQRELLAAMMARESAVNYNQPLTVEEMGHLVEKLFVCATPNLSPTGKPVMHIIKMEDIDSLF